MPWRCQHPWLTSRLQALPLWGGLGWGFQFFNEVQVVKLPKPFIHLGYLGFQVFAVTFCQAAHDIQAFQFALCLSPRKLQNGVNAFLFGIADESAGIDDGYLAGCHFGVVSTTITETLQPRHQALGIHQIL